jgi:hypothetical protein
LNIWLSLGVGLEDMAQMVGVVALVVLEVAL